MTYIHSNHKNSLLNFFLAGLAVASVASIFFLVALYNNVVDLNHAVADAKTDLETVGARNVAANGELIATLHRIRSGGFAAGNNLVEEKHPTYIPLKSSWPIASQR